MTNQGDFHAIAEKVFRQGYLSQRTDLESGVQLLLARAAQEGYELARAEKGDE